MIRNYEIRDAILAAVEDVAEKQGDRENVLPGSYWHVRASLVAEWLSGRIEAESLAAEAKVLESKGNPS